MANQFTTDELVMLRDALDCLNPDSCDGRELRDELRDRICGMLGAVVGGDDPGEFVGTCPACGEPVYAHEPDGPVWTCPANLSESNPFRRDPLHGMTDDEWEAEMERSGSYSNCGEDHGFSCYEPLPLHSACYQKGDY